MTYRLKFGMKCKIRFAEEAKFFLFPKEFGPVWGPPYSVDVGTLTSGVNGPGND
jgi:hypothetical protein